MKDIAITYAKAPNGREILIVGDRVYHRRSIWKVQAADFIPHWYHDWEPWEQIDAEIPVNAPIPPDWVVFGGRF